MVIPTFNTIQLVERCLASIKAHSGPDLEVLVVDDGSRDSTAEVLCRRHGWVKLVTLPENVGFTRAVNRGLESVRGEIVVLLNSDTEIDSGSLDALGAAMEEDPGLGVAGASLVYPDGSPQWSGGPEPNLPWLFALASGLPGMLARLPGYRRLRAVRGARDGEVAWVTGAAMAFRREVWEQIGPLDESFRFYCQDLDFCLRAQESGWRVAVVPGFRVVHSRGATIEQTRRGVNRQSPELLWTDLVRWARKHRGPEWARRAARVMALGGRLRLLGRGLARWFVPGSAREGWRRDTLVYRRAVNRLLESARAL